MKCNSCGTELKLGKETVFIAVASIQEQDLLEQKSHEDFRRLFHFMGECTEKTLLEFYTSHKTEIDLIGQQLKA